MKRLKQLESENKQPKKAIADLTLEKQALKDIDKAEATDLRISNARFLSPLTGLVNC
jgi:hypothetical protein